MKRKVKLSFEALEKELVKVNSHYIWGGNNPTPSWDCVLNVFNYLDGSSYDKNNYHNGIKDLLGYDPSSLGGVKTDDISLIGQMGRMNVNHITSSINLNPNTGKTSSNESIMITFTGAGGNDHAAIVTGVQTVNGNTVYKYYDPTTGQNKTIRTDQTSAYAVGNVGSAGMLDKDSNGNLFSHNPQETTRFSQVAPTTPAPWDDITTPWDDITTPWDDITTSWS